MAKLTSTQRKSMPKSKFALVETKRVKNKKTGKMETKEIKRFPINDKAHARNALARIPVAKGLSGSEKKEVKTKAEKKLYGTSSPKKIAAVKKARSKK